MTGKIDNVPDELKTLKQWTLHDDTKTPIQINEDNAACDDQKTWQTLDRCVAAHEDLGIGSGYTFMLPSKQLEIPNEIVLIDYDHCVVDGKIVDPEVEHDLKEADSYWEISRSKKGIHLLVLGKKPNPKCRSDKYRNGRVEIYEQGRPCHLTGDVVEKKPIRNAQAFLNRICEELLIAVNPPLEPVQPVAPLAADYPMNDAAVLRRMGMSKNADSIAALLKGSWLNHKSQSGADLALMNHLAFFTRKDRAQMERLFGTSALSNRDKWKRKDYRERTIDRAIRDCVKVWEPPTPSKVDVPIQAAALKEVHTPPEQAAAVVASEPDSAIYAKAMDILEHGDPVDYITKSCNRSVLGADSAFRKLCCCMGAQLVNQSEGLHPKMSGDSGSGKTRCLYVFAHHLPPEAVVEGSMSNKAAFYHASGAKVLRILDDYRSGNEILDDIIKQTTSKFHCPYEYRTVIKNKPVVLHISAEQTWAITSVDASQDIQVCNRQLPINTDDSTDTTKKVNELVLARYGGGKPAYEDDEHVLVSRMIWHILREEGSIDVKIPFYDRIQWNDNSNRRNIGLFLDILISYTTMFRKQRKQDANGYYLAEEQDFESACKLFSAADAADELLRRFSGKEMAIVRALAGNTLTRAELAKAVKVGVSRISQIIYGEDGKTGLQQKLPALEIEEGSETKEIAYKETRTVRCVRFSLPPQDMWNSFSKVVSLRS